MPSRRCPLALLAAVALAGCGGGTGTLTGKVTYQGKPVVYGSVLVRCADGQQRSGNVEPDGSYTVLNVPAGPVKLAVVSPEPPDPTKAPPNRGRGERAPPQQAAAPASDRSKWVKLPDNYADPDQSGLTATVTAGTVTHDIVLK
jgi:hypothetical protein